MSKFEYPTLSRAEMITILAESQIIALSDSELKNPTPDFIADLYTRLLINLDLLPEEDGAQLEFSALEKLENPEHHVDSIRTVSLYTRIKQILDVLDCPLKFSMKDILRPQGDRTEFFLSVILNFFLHRDTKMNLMRPIWEDLTRLDEQRGEWESKISLLNEEIADYKVARESELTLVEELDSKVKELRQKITGLNSHQVSLRASSRKLKEKAGDMDGEIYKAESDLVQSIQENADLRSKIVQSPDKLQRALEEKKSVREEAKNAERLATQSFQEKTAVLDLYTEVHKKMSKHYAQMQSIYEQANSAKSIEKELKSLKTKISDDVVLDKSLDAKLVGLQGKEQKLDDLRKTLDKERDMEVEVATKMYNNVKSEMESRRQDLEARQKKVDAVLAEVDATNSEINSVKESGSMKVQELVHKCEVVVEQFQQYRDSLGLVLQKLEDEKDHLLGGIISSL